MLVLFWELCVSISDTKLDFGIAVKPSQLGMGLNKTVMLHYRE